MGRRAVVRTLAVALTEVNGINPSLRYRNAMATADRATGNAHAQSENNATAAAARTQPNKKPNSSCADLFSLSRTAVIEESRLHSQSIDARTALVRFPVITAAENTPALAQLPT